MLSQLVLFRASLQNDEVDLRRAGQRHCTYERVVRHIGHDLSVCIHRICREARKAVSVF
ncbi:MAG: hypothetical protein H6905_10170 [Hyphomicrobiales bacterium]|nr:hypothetical protein [Hyphomicrobiales bacterium]